MEDECEEDISRTDFIWLDFAIGLRRWRQLWFIESTFTRNAEFSSSHARFPSTRAWGNAAVHGHRALLRRKQQGCKQLPTLAPFRFERRICERNGGGHRGYIRCG